MRRFKRNVLYVLSVILAGCVTGCGTQSIDSKAQISIPIYEKYQYSTEEVQKGDLEPVLDLLLRVDDFRTISYSVDKEDLEIDTIYVAQGDKVKAGDTLISFKSGDIESEIAEYQNQLEEDELLVEHYQRLKKLEGSSADGSEEAQSSGYSSTIKELKQEMEILKLRISEAQQVLKGYNIVAEADGTIAKVDENLYFGYVIPGEVLFSETCGSENYTSTVKDDYDFEVGQTFVAKAGVAEYEMKLKSIEEGQNEGERQLIFEPVSDMSGVSETDNFTISIAKPKIQNVVYVSSKAVFAVNDKYYVYVMDENGFRDAVEVTIGDTVGEVADEVTVITSGLNGGEQVMIR